MKLIARAQPQTCPAGAGLFWNAMIRLRLGRSVHLNAHGIAPLDFPAFQKSICTPHSQLG